MYMGYSYFEELTIGSASPESASAVQAVRDYLHDLQHMTGIWELDLHRLRLEADGEAAEITDLHASVSDEHPTWNTAIREFPGTIWSDDAPLMQLACKMACAQRIRLLADYEVTADDSVSYGTIFWDEYFCAHDTPTLRRDVCYRCIFLDEIEDEYYTLRYGPGGMEAVPFTSDNKDLPAVSAWSAREFSIFSPSTDRQIADDLALEEAHIFNERYMMGEGHLSTSPDGFLLSGPVTVRADEMESLFRDAETIRQQLAPYADYAEIDATFLPDRTSGNEVFALVHVNKQDTFQVESVLL